MWSSFGHHHNDILFLLLDGRKKKNMILLTIERKAKIQRRLKNILTSHGHFGLLPYDTWDLSACEMGVKKQKDSIKQKHQEKNK